LYEQKQNETAAILASKIYYHLGEDQEALAYALKAGKLFQPEEESEYALWIVCKSYDPLKTAQKVEGTGYTQMCVITKLGQI